MASTANIATVTSGDESLQVDFTSLAIKDPAFGDVYQRKGYKVDFHDPEMMQCLTKSTLKVHFGLKIDLPPDRLCPPVPIRYEYIRWIQALMDSTSAEYIKDYDSDRQIIGLDIGTGASCIYPLLGCSTRLNWRFGATDIDSHSLASARSNIALNKFQNRIRLHDTSSKDAGPADHPAPLLPLSELSISRADFVMCNPPFYSSASEMRTSAANKSLPPNAVCTGADVEMVTEGGDYGFAMRMLEESLVLRENVGWYSLMLGKLSSAQKLVERIKSEGLTNWAVKCLVVGKATRRWCVAWSFGALRPANDAARGTSNKDDILPFPTEFSIKDLPPSTSSNTAFMTTLRQTFTPLDATLIVRPNDLCVIFLSNGDVWSRSARRKRAREANAKTSTEEGNSIATIHDPDDDLPDHSFAVKVSKNADEQGTVVVRWLRGQESVLFESFCGMIRRAFVSKD